MSVKRRVGKAICHPLVGRIIAGAFRDRIPSRGCIINTSSTVVSPEVKAMLFWRIYESAENRFIDKYLRRDLDVIELGASLGVITCQIRRRINPSRQLVCVEANPDLAAQVQQNIRLNSLTDNVSIMNKAINYNLITGGTVSFAVGHDNLGGGLAEQQTSARTIDVESTTLAKIIEENGIKDYVLVSDIEGAEAGIILHEQEALKKCRQVIIELHDTDFNGKSLNAQQMCRAFCDVHGFTLSDNYGQVYVFER